MNALISLRRIAVVTTLVVLGLGWPVSAVQAGKFQASGTDTITLQRGNHVEGTTSGVAQPGGRFTGAYSGKLTGWVSHGEETWTFGGGHTLTFTWELEAVEPFSPVWVGTWVIIGGTGRYANATGSGDYLWIGHGDGTADFFLEGELSR